MMKHDLVHSQGPQPLMVKKTKNKRPWPHASMIDPSHPCIEMLQLGVTLLLSCTLLNLCVFYEALLHLPLLPLISFQSLKFIFFMIYILYFYSFFFKIYSQNI